MNLCNKSDIYQTYLYSYPHKTAYRYLDSPVNLKTVWKHENKSSLFLYLHIPFCRKKCGFCNLFSISRPDAGIVDQYLEAMGRQAEATKEFLDGYQYARYALGGGTPSFLNGHQLEYLFDLFHNTLAIDRTIPGSIEISPETVSDETLELFAQHGVDRISVGIQSFSEDELKVLSRNQSQNTVVKHLEKIKTLRFPILNIDLIYGIKGQTQVSFLDSLKTALRFNPEELYLYPLYIRPFTKLAGQKRSDIIYPLYQHGRYFLLSNGYSQKSMRLFRRSDVDIDSGPTYCCQEDGMIGLGTGARSYTTHFHYSTPYAASRKQSVDIIKAFNNKNKKDFLFADYGIHLTIDEKKRRYLIKSILQCKGLERRNYRRVFSTDCVDDFTCLIGYETEGLLTISDSTIQLTEKGTAFSDMIGPDLISDTIKKRMRGFTSE